MKGLIQTLVSHSFDPLTEGAGWNPPLPIYLEFMIIFPNNFGSLTPPPPPPPPQYL